MREAQVLASIDLPVEAFIAEANVNILTSLLFLRRKSDEEKRMEALGGAREYQVFMAVAEKVGIDRRGNKLYKRTPDGEEIVEPRLHVERLRIGGNFVERTLSAPKKSRTTICRSLPGSTGNSSRSTIDVHCGSLS